MPIVRSLDSFMQDLVYALRGIRHNRVFVGTAILTLALAIGGNTAMFAIVRSVLLKPLQYNDSERLVSMAGSATPTRLAEMKADAHSFADIAAYTREENVTLSNIPEPEVLRSVHISASFLSILEIDPMIGRGFRSEEDSSSGEPVAMISAELWQRRFGADPQILGKSATINAASYAIIGVLPPRFEFPSPGLDIWMTAPSDLPTIHPELRSRSHSCLYLAALSPE